MIKNLCLYGQKVIDIAEAKVEYIEALARVHNDGIHVSPFSIVDKKDIDTLALLDAVLKRISGFMEISNYKFGVNVELNDLLDETKYQKMLESIEKRVRQKNRLILEIVEDCYINEQNIEILDRRINILKNMGLFIALDDFGVKFSNFARLTYADADYLKLDMSIVKNIVKTNNGKLRNLIKSINGFDERVKIIVEGVETQNELSHFIALSFRYFQGYFFEMPTLIDKKYLQADLDTNCCHIAQAKRSVINV